MNEADVSPAVPSGTRCPQHPDRPAVGICTRCGGFACHEDLVSLDDKPFCAKCAALPEVDYLEAFRLKYWGKRDGWAWLTGGLGGVVNLSLAVASLAQGNLLLGAYALGAVCLAVCYWLGLGWARKAIFAIPIVGAFINASTVGAAAVGQMVVPFLVLTAMYQDTRNRLFFKVPVSTERLRKAWNLHANNAIARLGFVLGLGSLLICPLALAGLPCSIVGLTRVDPSAHPPIGRKGQAIAGTVLSALGLVEAMVIAALLLASRR